MNRITVVTFTILCTITIALTAAEQRPTWIEEARNRIQQVKSGQADKSILNEPFKESAPTEPVFPLCKAIACNEYSVMRELLEAEADPNLLRNGMRPLEYAGTKKTVIELINHGADPKRCARNLFVAVFKFYFYQKKREEITTEERLTEQFETMDILREKGADINNYCDKMYPIHPIYKVAEQSSVSDEYKKATLKYLISHGCNPNRPLRPDGANSLSCLTVLSKFKILSDEDPKHPLYDFIKQQYDEYLAAHQNQQ